jgi:hypothetical protein
MIGYHKNLPLKKCLFKTNVTRNFFWIMYENHPLQILDSMISYNYVKDIKQLCGDRAAEDLILSFLPNYMSDEFCSYVTRTIINEEVMELL